MTTNKQPGKHYQIVVKGHLEARWSQWFNGMAILNLPGGEAVLSGPIVDQAALHGLLIKIRDLGLPLISVSCFENEERQKNIE